MDIFIPYTGNDDLSILLMLEQLETRYRDTNNSLYAIHAYQHAFKTGRPIPNWVLEFFAGSFHEYLINSGTKTLDQCFQVSISGGRGKDTPFKMFLLDERNEGIMCEMFRLVALMGISQDDAAYMVEQKLKQSDWNKTMLELTEIKAETIRDMYNKKGYKNRYEALDKTCDLRGYFTSEKQLIFLDTFPPSSIPLGLKERISHP